MSQQGRSGNVQYVNHEITIKNSNTDNALFRGCKGLSPVYSVIWIYADLEESKYLPKNADFRQTVLGE